jgi:hypothetical protein
MTPLEPTTPEQLQAFATSLAIVLFISLGAGLLVCI